jgi:hypothetical protein
MTTARRFAFGTPPTGHRLINHSSNLRASYCTNNVRKEYGHTTALSIVGTWGMANRIEMLGYRYERSNRYRTPPIPTTLLTTDVPADPGNT